MKYNYDDDTDDRELIASARDHISCGMCLHLIFEGGHGGECDQTGLHVEEYDGTHCSSFKFAKNEID